MWRAWHGAWRTSSSMPWSQRGNVWLSALRSDQFRCSVNNTTVHRNVSSHLRSISKMNFITDELSSQNRFIKSGREIDLLMLQLNSSETSFRGMRYRAWSVRILLNVLQIFVHDGDHNVLQITVVTPVFVELSWDQNVSRTFFGYNETTQMTQAERKTSRLTSCLACILWLPELCKS